MSKDIKLLRNSNQQFIVLKYNFKTDDYKPIVKLGNNIHLNFIYDKKTKKVGIYVEDGTSTSFKFYLENFRSYEISPSPEIRFSSDIETLMDIFIDDIFSTALSGSNLATEAKQQETINKLNDIDSKTGDILTLTDLELWEYTFGNSKEFEYYTDTTPGTDPDNLSGNNKNIKFIIYKTGLLTVITQQLFYDALNRIIKIESV